MTLRLQIIIAVLVVLILVYMINMVRKHSIDLRYSLKWFLLCILVLILDVFPGILTWLAKLAGIAVPSNMIFFVAILLLLLTVYSLTASVSRLSEKTRRLTQEIAILRDEVERLKEDR